MVVLFFTGAGLGIGSCISWLVERKPYLLSSSIPKKPDVNLSSFSILSWLTMLLTGSIFYALGILGLPATEVALHASFLILMLAVTVFDLKYQLIPNRLILAGITAWCILAVTGVVPFISSLLAGASAASVLLLIRRLGYWLYKKAGMGMGDVKLLFFMGLFLEWEVIWALYLAIAAGGLYSGAGLLLQKIDRNGSLPFAPFLLIGSLSTFFLPFNRVQALWM